MPTECHRPPLPLQLGAMLAAAALVFRTVDDQAVATGLYALNIWNVMLWLGVIITIVSFARWRDALVFQKPLWLALGGSLILCLKLR